MRKKLINRLHGRLGKVKRAVQTFKADELGLSGVVVAVLLILVAVLAIVIIWGFLSGYLEDLWVQIIANSTIE